MDICEYIQKIKNIIKTERDYDSYRYIFNEYIEFLETWLKHNPSDIKAICQLAIMYFEDRRDTDICVQLMEDALTQFGLYSSKESLCELLNNLAFFYDVECGDKQKAVKTLKRAIELKSNYPNSYYALAYLLAESDSSFAFSIMDGISQKENLPINYRYLFSYIMMRNALYEDGLKGFEDLSRCDDVELSEKSLYCCAIIKSISGKVKESSEIADRLYKGYKEGKNEEISTFELIYLYFKLQNYEKVVGLFSTEKTENIHIDVDIIKLYFYSLKVLGLGAECERVYLAKVNEIKNELDETKSDEDYSDSEKLDYINSYEKDIEILTQNYINIVLKNNIVEVDDILYYCKTRKVCYLIDCPRHS